MKTGIFVAVLCFGAINLLAQPNNSSPKPESNSAGNSKATPTPEHNGIAAKDAESTKGSSPKGYASSEWMLVYIAALTGLAIAYQAREMAKTTEIIGKQADLIKRQADIYDKQREIMDGQLGTMRGQLAEMNRQVVLQQTGMSQWVTFQGWRHKVKKNTGGDGVLEFNFDIVNPTNWPMNLVSTILRIRGRELMTNHFVPLLPKEPYTVGMSQIVMGQGGGYFEGE